MPIAIGARAELEKLLEQKFVLTASEMGYNLVDFPEVMPEELIDSKFLEEDWQIRSPEGDKFVLTPEITAFYAALLEQNPKMTDLRSIIYTAVCYRENRFKQLGLETVDNSEESDVRALMTAYNFCSELGLDEEVEMVVNDLAQLKQTLNNLGVVGQERVLKLMDTYSSKARDSIIDEEFAEQIGSLGPVKPLLEIVKTGSYTQEISQEFSGVLEQLQQRAEIRVNAALARGLSYYNSEPPRTSTIIFEIYSKKDNVQLCGGGRYDGLVGSINPNLQGTDLDKGVGFAFGLERLTDVVEGVYGSASNALEVLK
ncbi:MAG: Histidine--tRNA ligase [Candidatus Woesearchaeota archaeon]|nr:Histidine--tRNA ligase [Candidatus Woesearchaeota archaeon]